MKEKHLHGPSRGALWLERIVVVVFKQEIDRSIELNDLQRIKMETTNFI